LSIPFGGGGGSLFDCPFAGGGASYRYQKHLALRCCEWLFAEHDESKPAHALVIFTDIWQKLSNIEREVTLIVTHFWQLFSQIFGETLLIVTNIWRKRTCFLHFYYFVCCSNKACKIEKWKNVGTNYILSRKWIMLIF
jgi:hypothetical protein